MNRSYVFLITILIILAVAIGGFALYRSTSHTTPTQLQTISTNPTPLPSQTATPPPSPTTPLSEADQIAATNTLPLTITTPPDNTQVTTPTLTISGTTSPNADVAVNDKDLKADAKGKFATTITLDEGENYIFVVASSETGASEKDLTITYLPSQ